MPRAFTAIDIPMEIAEKLAETQQEIGVGTPVKPEKMHVTLEFFQNLSQNQMKQVRKGLSATDAKPFQMRVKGLGVFPSKHHIRVLWAGIESEKIGEVHREISGLTVESDNDHDFLPHVTINRIKDMRRGDKKRIHRGLEKYSEEVFGEFEVSQIKFYRSEFMQKGTEYREIYVEKL